MMTMADLYRTLAEKEEECAQLRVQVQELSTQAEQLRQALLKGTPPEWLSVNAAARYICKSASWLHKDRLEDVPRIPFRQECTGGLVFYTRVDLDRYNESRMHGRKKAA